MIVQRYPYPSFHPHPTLHSERTIVLQTSVLSIDLRYSVCLTEPHHLLNTQENVKTSKTWYGNGTCCFVLYQPGLQLVCDV